MNASVLTSIPAEDLEDIKNQKFWSMRVPLGEIKVKGTCRLGGYIIPPGSDHEMEKCHYGLPMEHLHFEHCHMDTLEDMTKQGQDRDGYLLAILVGIGNKLTDYIYFMRLNIRTLFAKLDAIAKVLTALPTKEEYAEERKDDKHILELLKMVARRQGMTQKQIDELRPIEYTAPEEEQA